MRTLKKTFSFFPFLKKSMELPFSLIKQKTNLWILKSCTYKSRIKINKNKCGLLFFFFIKKQKKSERKKLYIKCLVWK